MKRAFYKLLLAAVAFIGMSRGYSQVLLSPATQPKFVNPLPIPSVIDARTGGTFTINITQFKQGLGLVDPVTLAPLLTTVWGYNNSYPGPTVVARSGVPVNFFFLNNLVNQNGGLLPHLLPIDSSLHWALEGVTGWETKGIPIVTHLHGGQTEAASDGGPDQWYTPNFVLRGPAFQKGQNVPYFFSNNQEASTIWYHDHALGITRLNVYAGLAGFYIVTDDNEAAQQAANKLPAAPYDIGLAIQDRMFTSTGELYYPSLPPIAGAPNPSVQPEMFGDHILVNGMAWPVLDVEPRAYRFRMLDGSDSRFYDLYLSTGQAFTQIGGDLGLLPATSVQTHIVIGPGERKEVIIDFSAYTGQTIIMKNNARTPYPRGLNPDPATTGKIMAFRVSKPLNPAYPQTQLPTSLRPPLPVLATTLPARQLILFEGVDTYGRLQTRLGTTTAGGLAWESPVTENPALGSTEIWEIYNNTVDAHPIHVHMVKMQLVSRQKFNATVDLATGITTNIKLTGNAKGPGPDEAGWKDTYIMAPGEVTRVITTFNIPGASVWHCHILSHEDHEMMRPFFIGNMSAPMTSAKTVDAGNELEQKIQFRARPNPFTSDLLIEFNLHDPAAISIIVYDANGTKVRQVFEGKQVAGSQQFHVNGTTWSNGTYFCEVLVNNQRIVRKLVLQK